MHCVRKQKANRALMIESKLQLLVAMENHTKQSVWMKFQKLIRQLESFFACMHFTSPAFGYTHVHQIYDYENWKLTTNDWIMEREKNNETAKEREKNN